MLLYLFCFLTAAGLLAADQWTKFWVETHMALEEIRPLLPPVLELHAVHNYGAAWSLFDGARWVLVGITAAMMLAVAAVLILRLVRHPLGVFSAFLILSGGVGNLLDRIFQGYVVDMLRFPFWTSYPTFNVADMCVVTGCVLWLLYVILIKEEPLRAEGTSSETGQAGAELPSEAPWEETGDGQPPEEVSAEDAAEPLAAQAADAQDGASEALLFPETEPLPEEPPADPERPPVDPALLGGSPWKKMFEEEDERESAYADAEDGFQTGGGHAVENAETGEDEAAGRAGNGEAAGRTGDGTGEAVHKTAQGDYGGDGKRQEAGEYAEAQSGSDASHPDGSGGAENAEAADGSAKAVRDWDSAESFFGGTPFREAPRDGRVWP